MDQLHAMRVFVRVAERASFSAVAKEASTTQSQVSRQVAHLESHLGAHLFTRTTRSVTLTDEGRLYLDFARRALAEADEGAALVRNGMRRVRGRLRLAMSNGVLRHFVLDAIEPLLAAHPELHIDFTVNDQVPDLVAEGIDLAIRVGALEDSGLMARKLAELPRVVVASRRYLERTAAVLPAIVTPETLTQHQCIVHAGPCDRRWHFETDHGPVTVNVGGRVSFSVGEMVREAALRDLGVALGPRQLFADGIESGKLVQLLPGFRVPPVAVHAVYPASRRHVARVEKVIEHLLAHFAKV